MADWGTRTGQVRDPSTVTRPQSAVNSNGTSYTHVPDHVYSYGTIAGMVRSQGGSTEIVEVIVYTAPPPSVEAEGDHLYQAVLNTSVDNNLGRHTLYMVNTNEKLVIKEIRLLNSASASRDLTLWIKGIEYRYTLPAIQTAGYELIKEVWTVLYPADLIEASSSASGVAVAIDGVLEVKTLE